MAADSINVLVLEHEILPVLTPRRSPRAYADQPVSADVLHQVFTDASSASSCFGEQAWRLLVGTRAGAAEAYDKILASFAEFNQP